MKAIVKQPIHEWPFSTPSLLSAIFQHRSLGIRVRESVGELRLAAHSRHLTTGVARAVGLQRVTARRDCHNNL